MEKLLILGLLERKYVLNVESCCNPKYRGECTYTCMSKGRRGLLQKLTYVQDSSNLGNKIILVLGLTQRIQ